jgi:hypothetical protein
VADYVKLAKGHICPDFKRNKGKEERKGKMAKKTRSNCLGCYFYEVNVWDASFAKHIVWAATNAILSPSVIPRPRPEESQTTRDEEDDAYTQER